MFGRKQLQRGTFICFLCFPRKISTFNLWIIRFAIFCRRIVILLGIYTYQGKITVQAYDSACSIWKDVNVLSKKYLLNEFYKIKMTVIKHCFTDRIPKKWTDRMKTGWRANFLSFFVLCCWLQLPKVRTPRPKSISILEVSLVKILKLARGAPLLLFLF